MNDEETSSEMAYIIHYTNPDLVPIGVKASGRAEACKIGRKARPNEQISAAVREDEGAVISQTERESLSTQEQPRKFIEEIIY